ncbi:MAG: hypothetical protein LBG05_08985 [Treponema sp.]|jgi:YbbR domain-containing protein|nr:hypothetical protein [Treponema sp.]
MDYRKLLLKIAENWSAKMLSIAFAIVLFVLHRTSTMAERFFSVPLKVETDGSYTPSSSYEHNIRVSMRGETNSIYPILENDIEAFVDIKDKGKGFYRLPVQIRKKGTAIGVDPLEITVDPLEIALSIDYKVSKYVPLTANIRGAPKEGFKMVSSTLTPNQVVIDGPSGVIANIVELFTEDIDIDGRDEDFSVVVNILNNEPLAIVRGNGSAEYKGFVQPITSQKVLDRLPIAVKGLDEKQTTELSVRDGSITLLGKQQSLEEYAAYLSVENSALLSVNCSDIHNAGVYELPVTATVPSEFSIVALTPQTVSVRVFVKEEE